MGKLFQELDEMFATDIVDDDLMVIEDVSSDTTMRLKWSEFQKRIVIENENIADEAVKSHNIDFETFPFEITGMYPEFIESPTRAGTAGANYAQTLNLPRARAAGEQVILMPVSNRWNTAYGLTVGTTNFSYQQGCHTTTSGMTNTWSAIYYKAH